MEINTLCSSKLFPMVFPVKTPYVVGPDLTKLEGPFIPKEVSPAVVQAKIQELEAHGAALFALAEGAEEWVGKLSEYCGLPYTESITELALQLEEDIAILKDGVLVGICFCFPSSFVPGNLLNRNFFQLHEPVADNATLQKASTNLVKHIGNKGNQFRRYVWTISTLKGLSQFPGYVKPTATKIEDLYFRTETQTTVGMGDGLCFFFVKVEMTPFGEVWEDGEKRKVLVSSLNSMSEAVLEYKGLKEIKKLINQNALT